MDLCHVVVALVGAGLGKSVLPRREEPLEEPPVLDGLERSLVVLTRVGLGCLCRPLVDVQRWVTRTLATEARFR